MVDLDTIHGQGPGNCKMNVSLSTHQAFENRISKLVRRKLLGAIVNNCWWKALKRAIRVEKVGFSKEIILEKSRIEGNL